MKIYKTAAGGAEVMQRYRQALAAWPVPSEERRVPTREGETFVLISGPADGPPLVLCHGSGANAARWGADIALWAKHFRVFAVDMIGEPGLSAPARPQLGSDAYALWLDDVLDKLGLSTVAMLGESLGGWLALDYATKRPSRVSRLTLLCPGGLGRQTYGWVLPSLLLKPFGRWGSRRTLKLVAGLDWRVAPEEAAYVGLVFKHFLPRRDKLPVFTDDELARLTMPVQVTVGAHDAMFDSAETAARVRAAIPDAEVRLLPDAAHTIPGQAGQVLEFLRK